MSIVCCTKVGLSVLVVYLTSSVSVIACGNSEMASIFNIGAFINLKKCGNKLQFLPLRTHSVFSQLSATPSFLGLISFLIQLKVSSRWRSTCWKQNWQSSAACFASGEAWVLHRAIGGEQGGRLLLQ